MSGQPKEIIKKWPQLKKLKIADRYMRCKLLKDKKLLTCLCEIALNVVLDHIPLSRHERKYISEHSHDVKKLASKLTPIAKKKKIAQAGGGLVKVLLSPTLYYLNKKLKLDSDTEEGSEASGEETDDEEATDDTDTDEAETGDDEGTDNESDDEEMEDEDSAASQEESSEDGEVSAEEWKQPGEEDSVTDDGEGVDSDGEEDNDCEIGRAHV